MQRGDFLLGIQLCPSTPHPAQQLQVPVLWLMLPPAAPSATGMDTPQDVPECDLQRDVTDPTA